MFQDKWLGHSQHKSFSKRENNLPLPKKLLMNANTSLSLSKLNNTVRLLTLSLVTPTICTHQGEREKNM